MLASRLRAVIRVMLLGCEGCSATERERAAYSALPHYASDGQRGKRRAAAATACHPVGISKIATIADRITIVRRVSERVTRVSWATAPRRRSQNEGRSASDLPRLVASDRGRVVRTHWIQSCDALARAGLRARPAGRADPSVRLLPSPCHSAARCALREFVLAAPRKAARNHLRGDLARKAGGRSRHRPGGRRQCRTRWAVHKLGSNRLQCLY
jgi:hypothetical protein